MTPAIIIVLLTVAFILARLFRSTGMWWKLVFAITAGLLVGILSKEVVKSDNDKTTSLTSLVSTMSNDDALTCMQSLVATVTEGTTVRLTGVAGYIIKDEELFDALTKSNTFTNGRDSPEIEDDS